MSIERLRLRGRPLGTAIAALLALLVVLAAGAQGGAARAAEGWTDRFFPFPEGGEEGRPAFRELLLDGFDSPGSWSASMSSDEGYARSALFPARPGQGRFGGPALGLRVDFLRRAASSVSLRPARPLIAEGTCIAISVRVLGRNFRHSLKAVVADYYGAVIELPMGRLDFSGWRTLRAGVPRADGRGGGIVQDDPHYDRPAGLRVIGLKIEFEAEEAEGSFFAYFGELRALCETIEPVGAEPAGAAVEAGAEAAAEPAAIPAAPPGPAPASAPDDAAKTARMLAGIKERIAANLAFPAAAKRRGVEGTVTVAVVIGADGGFAEARITSSSGSGILDEAGLELLRSVLPVDNELGRRVRLEVPIAYRLVDAGP